MTDAVLGGSSDRWMCPRTVPGWVVTPALPVGTPGVGSVFQRGNTW
uniref:Uncharacterized protein n=1 Tax=Serinus canaria TaxID=9135 RepID=A0A8C9MXD3_SERCA